MRSWLPIVLYCATAPLWPAVAYGQQGQPRSDAYLFVSAVDDARAAWVNPAGLGWVPEASVMGELVLDRAGGSLRLGQYTVGLNSRGLALAYERDRSEPNASIGVARIALGVPVGHGSLGASLSTYGSRKNEGFDLGVRYRLLAGLDGAAVVRNLARPVTHGIRQPIVGVAGLTWTLTPQAAAVSAEVLAAERLGMSGYDVAYRAGMMVRTHRPWPVALHAAAELGSDGTMRRWAIGLVFGRLDRVGLVAGAAPAAGLGAPDQFSAVGIATRRAPAFAP